MRIALLLAIGYSFFFLEYYGE